MGGLGGELVFRGGTCLHKLHLDTPRRYSEDLDYVRTTAGGIKDLTAALTDLGRDLGLAVPFTVDSPWWSGTALVRAWKLAAGFTLLPTFARPHLTLLLETLDQVEPLGFSVRFPFADWRVRLQADADLSEPGWIGH